MPAEFARGPLLGQVLLDDLLVKTVFTAKLHTEIMLIFAAPVGAVSGTLNMFHDDSGSNIFDTTTALFANFAATIGEPNILAAAQCVGAGIHMQPGAQLAFQQTVATGDVNISVYGILQSVAPRS